MTTPATSTQDAYDAIMGWFKAPWIRMAHITRYSSLPVVHQESVAEHSFFVCLFAYALALRLNEEREEKVNVFKVLRGALTHDLDESLSGDFIRPFKYSSPELKKLLAEAASTGLQKVAATETIAAQQFYHDWLDAKGMHSIEAQIVYLADLFSCAQYARRELQLGNSFAKRVLDELPRWTRREQWHPRLRPWAEAISQTSEVAGQAEDLTRSRAPNEMSDPFYEQLVAKEVKAA